MIKNGLYKTEELSTFNTPKELIKEKLSLSIAGGPSRKRKMKLINNQREDLLGFNNFLLAGEKTFLLRSTTEFENFYLLDCLISWGIMVFKEMNDKSSINFFSENFNGYSTIPPTLALLQKIHENNPLKQIGIFEVLYHEYEENDCGRCISNSFVEDGASPTTVEELKRALTEQIPSPNELKTTDKAYIFIVNLISCTHSKDSSHVAVLVIAAGNDNESRAYYCDSCGCNMPNVLKNVLTEHLGIKADNIDCSCFKQQTTKSFCSMFILENSLIISRLMLKKASFEEIRDELIYRPTEEHLLGVRELFLASIHDRFLSSINREILFFSYSLDKLFDKLETHLLLIRKKGDIGREFSELKETKEILFGFGQAIKKREFSPQIKELFSVGGQRWIRVCLYYLSKLNFEYYSHLENELKKRLGSSFIPCFDCIKVLKNKIMVKGERKKCYLTFSNCLSNPSLIDSSQMFFRPQFLDLNKQIKITKRKSKDRKECFRCNRKWLTNEILLSGQAL